MEHHRNFGSPRRVHAPFSVQFRVQGRAHSWKTGVGVNISTGGLCIFFPAPSVPSVALGDEAELTLMFPEEECGPLGLEAQVRWYKETREGITVGLRVTNPDQQQALAVVLFRLRRQWSHQSSSPARTHSRVTTRPKPDSVI
jgi:PilZ domain